MLVMSRKENGKRIELVQFIGGMKGLTCSNSFSSIAWKPDMVIFSKTRLPRSVLSSAYRATRNLLASAGDMLFFEVSDFMREDRNQFRGRVILDQRVKKNDPFPFAKPGEEGV